MAPELAAPIPFLHTMSLPAPAVALLWDSGWTVPGAVGRRKVGEQPSLSSLHTSLRARAWLFAWTCIQLARRDFLDPAQTEPVPLGLCPPSLHLPCLTYVPLPCIPLSAAPGVRAHWPLGCCCCCCWGALCLCSSNPLRPTASPFCSFPSIEICRALVASWSCPHLLLLLLLL